MRLVRRWLPGRAVVFVADSSFAALELLDQVAQASRVSVITRLRLDAALYDPPPPRALGQRGRPRCKGKRRPTREAVLADEQTPTQRQWNDRAIARATPVLVSLYSIITLPAHLLIDKGATCMRITAWYGKTRLTFSDAIALVWRQLWAHMHFSTSPQATEMIHIPRAWLERFTDALCYAA